VLYASSEGQTAKIAHHIAEQLELCEVRAHVQDVDAVPDEFSLVDYDGIIVGGSIHLGKVQASLRRHVRRYRATLEEKPSAFFIVCLNAASQRPEAADENEQLM